MQHCIGHGSYDRRLLEGTHRYLSLRDPSGNPHATLEVEHTTDSTGNPVVQLQGKQNRRPLRKYLEKVAAYLERSEVKLYGHDYGMIRDIRGRIHFLDDLPEILEIDQSLTISAKDGEVLRLPRVIRCRKLSLSGTCFANTPEEIVATELLVLEGDLPLPKSLKVDGQLTIARSNIRELPSHLNVGSLTLYDTPNLELPDGLVVDGLLDLASSRMAITAIPSDTKFRDINISNRNIAVFDTSGYLPPRNGDDPAPTLIAQNGQLREIRGVKRFSRFEVANCDWTSLPDDLEVTHVLDISGTAIRTIPQGAVPEIMLVATDCRDLTLPSELDCEWVDLTGATVRMPKTVTCAGEIVLKNAKVTLIAEVMRAERISFEGAQIASLPDVIEAEVINLKHSSVRTLPNGLVAASVFISSGPLSIQPDTRLETLNVIIKQGIYSNHQNLSLDDARKAIEERGGVGLGEGAVARFMVYDDDFWHMIDRYPILESKRKSRKTGRHAFSVSSMKAFISQFLAGSRESTLAS